jgi:hypothetical protein
MKKLVLPALLLSGVFGAAHLAKTQTLSDAMALSDYRAALDQVGAGQAQKARTLLEQGLRRGEIAPESAALLAYLEEKFGQNERARQVLQGVATPTSMTAAYLERLNGGARAIEVAKHGNDSAAKNPALLASSDARIEK